MQPRNVTHSSQPLAVLFDLDGTLADTAKDLAYALNRTLQHYGEPGLSFERIRPVVSHGAIALIRLGFGMTPETDGFEERRQYLLKVYEDNLCRETTLFPGMARVLEHLESRRLPWGIVTNKPAWLTQPLMDALDLTRRASTIVSGDTLDERKPHPAPLLYACKVTGSKPDTCLYVGDAQRDIEAGHNAGMPTLVAMFGYLMAEDKPETWGATALVRQPSDILNWIA